MKDPTYIKSEIDANPIWKLAWEMSEYFNDNAPIGWYKYAPMATYVLSRFTPMEQSVGTETINRE